MEVAGVNTFGAGHSFKLLMGEKNGSGVFWSGFEYGCGKLEEFCLVDDFIDA